MTTEWRYVISRGEAGLLACRGWTINMRVMMLFSDGTYGFPCSRELRA